MKYPHSTHIQYCSFKNIIYRSDGACRHVAASLYEVESYQNSVKSVTDGPVQWAKRARASDEPEPVSSLAIRSVK